MKRRCVVCLVFFPSIFVLLTRYATVKLFVHSGVNLSGNDSFFSTGGKNSALKKREGFFLNFSCHFLTLQVAVTFLSADKIHTTWELLSRVQQKIRQSFSLIIIFLKSTLMQGDKIYLSYVNLKN